MSTPAESPLPPAILRGLGDRSYEKRKTAALDVTAMIKSLQEAGRVGCVGLIRTIYLIRSEQEKHGAEHYMKTSLLILIMIFLT